MDNFVCDGKTKMEKKLYYLSQIKNKKATKQKNNEKFIVLIDMYVQI